MSFTVVNSANSGDQAAAFATCTISIAAGHTIVAIGSGGGNGVLGTFVDSAGNSYTAGTSATDGANHALGGAVSIAIANPITSLTYTPAGSGTDAFVAVWDITATGLITFPSSAGHFYNSNAPNTTNGISTGSMAITTSDGLLLAVARSYGGSTLSTGTSPVIFTQDGLLSFVTIIYEHGAITSSGAATFTTGTNNDFVQVAGVALQVNSGGSSIAWVT
jgi:hypothetical protein